MDKYVLEILKFCGLCGYTVYMLLVGCGLMMGAGLMDVLFGVDDLFFLVGTPSLVGALIISVLLFYILKKKYQQGWFWRSLVAVPTVALLTVVLIFFLINFYFVIFSTV